MYKLNRHLSIWGLIYTKIPRNFCKFS